MLPFSDQRIDVSVQISFQILWIKSVKYVMLLRILQFGQDTSLIDNDMFIFEIGHRPEEIEHMWFIIIFNGNLIDKEGHGAGYVLH